MTTRGPSGGRPYIGRLLPKTPAPEHLHTRVGAYAARRGLSLAGAIRELITAGLDATGR